MTETTNRIDEYLAQWIAYAKSLFTEEDLDALMMRLKLNIDAFFKEQAAPLNLSEKMELYQRIEGILSDRALFCDVVGIVPSLDEALAPGNVPIVGYTLIQRLGAGGYGEVWNANAPGGVEVALKFLPKTSILSAFSSNSELEALQIIKNIRHVNLVPISAIWPDENPAYIVYQMALLNSKLVDEIHFEEHPKGVSATTLLPYFRDAAAALDCLNHPSEKTPHPPILHGDVKPDNIFIQEKHAQLGDFGSVRIIDETAADCTGSYSPAFVAPERLQGRVSTHSDQYSLAASWFYLRTGHLLDAGADVSSVSSVSSIQTVPGDSVKKPPLQPSQSSRTIDLSELPKRERKILAKALSLNPNERYATNTEFVNALGRKRWIFPWVALVLLLALLSGLYVHSNVQTAQKEHAEYLTAAQNVSMQMAAQMLLFQELVTMVHQTDDEWTKLVEKYKSTPEMREEYVKDFLSFLDNRKKSMDAGIPKITSPTDVTMKILQKNGAEMEEIEAFYTQIYPGVCSSYLDYLNLMRVNAQNLSVEPGMIDYWKTYGNICCIMFEKEMGLMYCAYLELMTGMPAETREKAYQFLEDQKVTLCDNISKNLTKQQYLDKQAQILAESKELMESFGAPIDELGEEADAMMLEMKKDSNRPSRTKPQSADVSEGSDSSEGSDASDGSDTSDGSDASDASDSAESAPASSESSSFEEQAAALLLAKENPLLVMNSYYLKNLEEVETAWKQMYENLPEDSTARAKGILEFCDIINKKQAVWDKLPQDPMPQPSADVMKFLQKLGFTQQDLSFLYMPLSPGFSEAYPDTLSVLKMNALQLGTSETQKEKVNEISLIQLQITHIDIEIAYCAYFEFLANFPDSVQESVRQFFTTQKILYDGIPLTLKREEYTAKIDELLAALDELNQRLEDLGAFADPVTDAREEELNLRKQVIETKKQEVALMKDEVEQRKLKLNVLMQEIFEKTEFQETDSPWKKWGKMLRLSTLLRLRMSSGILPFEPVLNEMNTRWDVLAESSGSDEELRTCALTAKRFFILLSEKKIEDVGTLVYTIENHAEHPNLKAGDILIETNGHPVMKMEDLTTYANPDNRNVIKRMRFNDAGEPVFDTFTSTPDAPRAGYIEFREESNE